MISKRRRRREREREKKRIMIFLLVDGKKLCIWCETQLVERLWRFIIPALWVLMAGPVVLPERKSGGARRDFSILLFSCPAHPPCFSMCTTRLVYGLINWISRVRVWAAADKHQKSRRLRVRRCVNADEWAGDFCFVFFFSGSLIAMVLLTFPPLGWWWWNSAEKKRRRNERTHF